jgi:hypothetical protein
MATHHDSVPQPTAQSLGSNLRRLRTWAAWPPSHILCGCTSGWLSHGGTVSPFLMHRHQSTLWSVDLCVPSDPKLQRNCREGKHKLARESKSLRIHKDFYFCFKSEFQNKFFIKIIDAVIRWKGQKQNIDLDTIKPTYYKAVLKVNLKIFLVEERQFTEACTSGCLDCFEDKILTPRPPLSLVHQEKFQ